MKRIRDYKEKVMIVAYFTRNNKATINEHLVKKAWCQCWKFDFECPEYTEMIQDILYQVMDIQIPTSKRYPIALGKYRIKRTDYEGTYDEIKAIIKDKKVGEW